MELNEFFFVEKKTKICFTQKYSGQKLTPSFFNKMASLANVFNSSDRRARRFSTAAYGFSFIIVRMCLNGFNFLVLRGTERLQMKENIETAQIKVVVSGITDSVSKFLKTDALPMEGTK